MDNVLTLINERVPVLTNYFSYFDSRPEKVANFITRNWTDFSIFERYNDNDSPIIVVVNPLIPPGEGVSIVYTICNRDCPDRVLLKPFGYTLQVVTDSNNTSKDVLKLTTNIQEISDKVYTINNQLESAEQATLVLQLLSVSNVKIEYSLYKHIKPYLNKFIDANIVSYTFDPDIQYENQTRSFNRRMRSSGACYGVEQRWCQ